MMQLNMRIVKVVLEGCFGKHLVKDINFNQYSTNTAPIISCFTCSILILIEKAVYMFCTLDIIRKHKSS